MQAARVKVTVIPGYQDESSRKWKLWADRTFALPFPFPADPTGKGPGRTNCTPQCASSDLPCAWCRLDRLGFFGPLVSRPLGAHSALPVPLLASQQLSLNTTPSRSQCLMCPCCDSSLERPECAWCVACVTSTPLVPVCLPGAWGGTKGLSGLSKGGLYGLRLGRALSHCCLKC